MYKIITFQYGETTITNIIKLNEDNSMVIFTAEESNQDYQAYLKWLDEGNTPLPADE